MANDFSPSSRNFDFLAGGGEMGERMRALDWSKTPLGAGRGMAAVAQNHRSRHARFALCDVDAVGTGTHLFLQRCLSTDRRHEARLGARCTFGQGLGGNLARHRSPHSAGSRGGRATWDEGLPLFLERYGFAEETYHTFSYSPIYDDGSRIAGMLCVVTEVTDRVIGERRLRVLRDLAASPRAEATEEACKRLINVLADDPLDVSFACLYLLDQTHARLLLAHHHGDLPKRLLPAQIELADRSAPWPIAESIRSGAPQVVELPHDGPESIAAPLWPDRVRQRHGVTRQAGLLDEYRGAHRRPFAAPSSRRWLSRISRSDRPAIRRRDCRCASLRGGARHAPRRWQKSIAPRPPSSRTCPMNSGPR